MAPEAAGRTVPQPRPALECPTSSRCGGESGCPGNPLQREGSLSEKLITNNVPKDVIPIYYCIKPNLLAVFKVVGAVENKYYTDKEILLFLKSYIYKYDLINKKNPNGAIYCNDELRKALNVDKFEIYEVRDLLLKNLYKFQGCITSSFKLPEIPASDSDVSAAAEEQEIEYEPVTDEEEEEDNSDLDTDSDIESIILEILDSECSLDEDFFADISDSSTESDMENSSDSEPESEKWACLTCGIKNKPFMRYCLKCWTHQRQWFPERPKRRKKRKPRPKNHKLARESVKQTLQIVETPLARSDSGTSAISVSSTTTTTSSSGVSSVELGSYSLNEVLPEPQIASVKSEDASDVPEMKSLKRSNPSCESSTAMFQAAKMRKTSDSELKDNTENLCSLCYCRPKNASIIHGRLSHIGLCYPCAKKLYAAKKKCPFCRRKIHMVTKNSYV